MTFPFKFNIVSGILAGFVVIALLFATTPGGFGVTSYDRWEALSAAGVFFVAMCLVLWFTGRKAKAKKLPPHVYPTPKPPPSRDYPNEMLAIAPLALVQPIPALEGPVAVIALVAMLIGVAIGAGGLIAIGFRKEKK